MIDKMKECDERVKMMKKEREELKSFGFKQHVEFKKVMEKIIRKKTHK